MEAEPVIKTVSLTNRITELGTIETFLNEAAEEWDLPLSILNSLNLVVEEAFTNIVSYGYDDDLEHIVELQLERDSGELRILIADDGHEYDPTARADPDISLGADDRPVGGLGIYLIRKIMDSVEYRRAGNKNQLSMTKKI